MQAGARVSGHVERVRAGQAGRRIIEEAIDMRAAAIVMPLPRARRRRVAVRQDARDRAGRAAVPGDHRVRAGAGDRARGAARRWSGRASHDGASRVLPALMVRDRRRADRAHARGRRRRAAPSGCCSACCSWPRAPGGSTWSAALMPQRRRSRRALEAPTGCAGARQPGAVRDRPGLHRRLDLLLARPGRRARARADAGSSSWPAALLFARRSCPATSRARRCTRSAAARR